MPEVFISYSRKDTAFALKLTADLERQGIHVWIDQGDIVAGDAWRKQIVEGIQGCRVFLIVLSPNSAKSDNVIKELSLAETNRKKIIPILYQSVDIPEDMEYQLSGLQYQAFDRGNYEENVARLAEVINGIPATRRTSAAPSAPTRARTSSTPILIGLGIGCVVVLLFAVGLTATLVGPLIGHAAQTPTIQIAQGSPTTGVPTAPATTPPPPATTIAPPTTIIPPPVTTVAPTTPRPPTTAAPTRPPTSTPAPVVIPFGSTVARNQLNSAFRWAQGGSSDSSYALTDPNNITIRAGAHTMQWDKTNTAPMMMYSFNGDLQEVNVGIAFDPTGGSTAAGVGIQSQDDGNTYLRITLGQGTDSSTSRYIEIDQDQQGVSKELLQWPGFNFAPTTYLKISRRENIFTFSSSTDGRNWATVASGYPFQMPTSVQIFLVTLAWGNQGTSARFTNLSVLGR